MKIIRLLPVLLLLLLLNDATAQLKTISLESLKDKIKGGWAGQTIGVTFGGPVEFRFNGTMINDYQPIVWYDGYLKHTMENNAGLYDDLYMDLTFVDIFEREGLDAPIECHAKAFANAGYALWHANQGARYNILNGIMPPKSGTWESNPHADDIDFQIEADFSGLMSPGMPNTAAKIGDPIGHIMNSGEGWYGGVFVGAMYSLAFFSNDVRFIVTEALKTIPTQSPFYQCIKDVIAWHKQYPDDWKRNWFEIQKKWSSEVGCPDGVFSAFNIDAKVNAAYIVLGLLYGNGDYTRTLEISARAGQDADCNPSSAAGILGTMLGYEKIPAYWKMGLKEAEDIDFKYTTMSLNDVYSIGLKHALKIIEKNGGKVEREMVSINAEAPVPVRFEQTFPGHFPISKTFIGKDLTDEISFEVTGKGLVVRGEAKPVSRSNWDYKGEFSFQAEMYVDGSLIERVSLPANFRARRHELFWRYNLPDGKHKVILRLLNPDSEFKLRVEDVLVYGSTPYKATY
ncbi:MAG: ADP-ribosylglycohydrolase family protein [Bacteroidetes bacterium]|nr:ADP-ribosylglycohydrolase family protein [Bacteroidota bacterium]